MRPSSHTVATALSRRSPPYDFVCEARKAADGLSFGLFLARAQLYMLRKNSRFVSGHDFSSAEENQK
jgi:hypothetical protein